MMLNSFERIAFVIYMFQGTHIRLWNFSQIRVTKYVRTGYLLVTNGYKWLILWIYLDLVEELLVSLIIFMCFLKFSLYHLLFSGNAVYHILYLRIMLASATASMLNTRDWHVLQEIGYYYNTSLINLLLMCFSHKYTTPRETLLMMFTLVILMCWHK